MSPPRVHERVTGDFPNGQDQTLLGNVTQVYFGVNDHATADLVSARLGEETVVVASGGTTDGWSRQWSDGPQANQSTTRSGGSNDNWQLQPRKLLKPEEVAALPPRAAVTFAPGVPPVMTRLGRYYEDPAPGRPPTRWRRSRGAVGTLVLSATLCLTSLGTAVGLVHIARHRSVAPPTYQAPRALPSRSASPSDDADASPPAHPLLPSPSDAPSRTEPGRRRVKDRRAPTQ